MWCHRMQNCMLTFAESFIRIQIEGTCKCLEGKNLFIWVYFLTIKSRIIFLNVLYQNVAVMHEETVIKVGHILQNTRLLYQKDAKKKKLFHMHGTSNKSDLQHMRNEIQTASRFHLCLLYQYRKIWTQGFETRCEPSGRHVRGALELFKEQSVEWWIVKRKHASVYYKWICNICWGFSRSHWLINTRQTNLKIFIVLYHLKPTFSALNNSVKRQFFFQDEISFKVLSNTSHVCLTTSTLRMSYQVDFKTILSCHMSSSVPYDSDNRPLFQTWRSGKHVTVDKIKTHYKRSSPHHFARVSACRIKRCTPVCLIFQFFGSHMFKLCKLRLGKAWSNRSLSCNM